MHFLRHHPKEGVLIFVLAAAFLLTRFYNLFGLPIFTDEAIYIYWAKFIAVNHSNWFLSLADGKPPLLIWTIALLLSIFPTDWYLLAGRLPSIITGAMSLVAIFLLTKELFRTRLAGYFAASLYIVSPIILLYDRMALFDGMLQSMILLAVYFMVRTARTLSRTDAILWGFFLGLAILSKPTALLFSVMTPIAFIFLTKADFKKDWKKLAFSILSSLIISQILNNLQRVSGVYDRAALKNAQFQQPLEELFRSPFALTFNNLHGMYDWTVAYFSYPILIFAIIALVYLLKRHFRKGVILLAFWFVPLFSLATIGREIFPRYILFTTPYLLIIISYLLSKLFTRNIFQKSLTILVLLLILILPLQLDYDILTDPRNAKLAREDKQQYVTNHPSGYGVKEVTDRVDRELLRGKKVTLVTQGTFGLFPYAYTLKYWHDPRVTILPRWPLDVLDDEIYQKAKVSEVFIVLKEHDQIPEGLSLTLLERLPKPGGQFPILVAELKKEK